MQAEAKVSNITKVNQKLFIMGNASKKISSEYRKGLLSCVCVNKEWNKCFNNLVSTEFVKPEARLEMM